MTGFQSWELSHHVSVTAMRSWPCNHKQISDSSCYSPCFLRLYTGISEKNWEQGMQICLGGYKRVPLSYIYPWGGWPCLSCHGRQLRNIFHLFIPQSIAVVWTLPFWSPCSVHLCNFFTVVKTNCRHLDICLYHLSDVLKASVATCNFKRNTHLIWL